MKKRVLAFILAVPLLSLWTTAEAIQPEEEEEQTAQSGVGTGGESGTGEQTEQLETPPGTTTDGPGEPQIEGDPAAARQDFQRAQQAYLEGNYEEAADLFQQANGAWGHPAFMFNRAQCLRRHQRWREAVTAFTEYIAACERTGMAVDAVAYIHMAECHHQLNQTEQANQVLRRYLRASPQGEFSAVAQRCIESGESPAARDQRDARTVEQARAIHDEATALVRRQQYQQAAERFREGYRQYSEITEFLYNAATAYRSGQMWPQAVAAYQEYVQTPGATVDAHVELAQCLHQQGQFDAAVAAYRRYLQLAPSGDFAEDARQYIQSATSTTGSGEQASPETVRTAQQHFGQGIEHYQAGRYQEALAEFGQAYDLIPESYALFNVGMCYLRLRDWQRALTNFENVLRGGDAGIDASVHLRAAECELELNRPERAEQHIQDYLRRADAQELPEEDRFRQMASQLLERCR